MDMGSQIEGALFPIKKGEYKIQVLKLSELMAQTWDGCSSFSHSESSSSIYSTEESLQSPSYRAPLPAFVDVRDIVKDPPLEKKKIQLNQISDYYF